MVLPWHILNVNPGNNLGLSRPRVFSPESRVRYGRCNGIARTRISGLQGRGFDSPTLLRGVDGPLTAPGSEPGSSGSAGKVRWDPRPTADPLEWDARSHLPGRPNPLKYNGDFWARPRPRPCT
jgi:hypothetical protein